MQPSDLHYEKAAAILGWDKSLWPKRGYWLFSVRVQRWSELARMLALATTALTLGGWGAATSLAAMGKITVPDFLLPFRMPERPWALLVAGGIFVALGTVALLIVLATMTGKAWQALRGWHPLALPDPDYRAIDFRARRKR